MTEIKPCPFCGGKAEVFQRVKHNGFNTYEIHCLNCGIGTEESPLEEVTHRYWNRRADNE